MAVVAVMLAMAASATTARAAAVAPDTDGLSLDVVGACPSAAAVRPLLGELVSTEEARRATVSIQDRGRHYRVAVGAAATTLDDPARDCRKRARQATVVAARALQDPTVVLGPPVWTVEKGMVIEVAPSGKLVYGAEIRGAWGSGRWSVFGAGGARGPVTLELDDDWEAELLRLPLDAGLRVTSRRWRLRTWLAFGGSMTASRILGRDLVDMDPEWRIDFGALAMVGATLPVRGRIGLAAALAIRWEPRPHRLQVVPVGTVGETPAWWLGLSLNYTLDGKGSSP